MLRRRINVLMMRLQDTVKFCGGCTRGDGCFIDKDCCDNYTTDGTLLPTLKKTCQDIDKSVGGTCKPPP